MTAPPPAAADGKLIDELPHSVHKVDAGKAAGAGLGGAEAKGDFW